MKNSSYVSNKKHHIYILGKSSTQGGVDMKNSSYVSNKKHHIYILGKSSTQGLQYGATIYAEHDYAKVNGSQLNVNFFFFYCFNVLFGNLKIGNTKDTLHYRYHDGIGVFFDAREVMMEVA